MFLDKWIPEKFLVKSEVCGLELNFTADGIVLYYSLLRKKGKKLELVEIGEAKEISQLPKKLLKNKTPLLLVVNGRAVITKKVELNSSLTNLEDFLKQHMPAVNENEFFCQVYTQEGSAFISICRKEQLIEILRELKERKYDLSGMLIGAPAILGLEPFWGGINVIGCSSQDIQLANNEIDAIIPTDIYRDQKMSIEGINFSPKYSLGFAGGLSYLMRRKVYETLNAEINAIWEKHHEKNKLRFFTITAVSVVFLIAVVNVYFYTSYFDQNNRLETELSIYQGKYDQINNLLSDYQKKKELIENAGILNRSRISEFADRIAKTIPDEVLLTEMYFNPKAEDDETEDSLVTFVSKQLIIKGNCNKSLIINEWLNVLKSQKFIKDVSLEKFAYNSEANLPNCEIKIVTE